MKKKDDTYRVEKVLRKKNGMALVKWLGYDSRSWVPLKDINDVNFFLTTTVRKGSEARRIKNMGFGKIRQELFR